MVCKVHQTNHCGLHYADPIGSPEQQAKARRASDRSPSSGKGTAAAQPGARRKALLKP